MNEKLYTNPLAQCQASRRQVANLGSPLLHHDIMFFICTFKSNALHISYIIFPSKETVFQFFKPPFSPNYRPSCFEHGRGSIHTDWIIPVRMIWKVGVEQDKEQSLLSIQGSVWRSVRAVARLFPKYPPIILQSHFSCQSVVERETDKQQDRKKGAGDKRVLGRT